MWVPKCELASSLRHRWRYLSFAADSDALSNRENRFGLHVGSADDPGLPNAGLADRSSPNEALSGYGVPAYTVFREGKVPREVGWWFGESAAVLKSRPRWHSGRFLEGASTWRQASPWAWDCTHGKRSGTFRVFASLLPSLCATGSVRTVTR